MKTIIIIILIFFINHVRLLGHRMSNQTLKITNHGLANALLFISSHQQVGVFDLHILPIFLYAGSLFVHLFSYNILTLHYIHDQHQIPSNPCQTLFLCIVRWLFPEQTACKSTWKQTDIKKNKNHWNNVVNKGVGQN